MKKIFTLIAFAVCSITAMATDYTDQMVITVKGLGEPTTQQATISVTKQDDGKYTMTLKNFSYSGIGVGTIEMKDIDATEDNDVTKLSTNQDVAIVNGDDPNITYWMLGGQTVPITFNGELYGTEKMYANMDITYKLSALLSLNINVVFGTKQATGVSSIIINHDDVERVYDLNGNQLNEEKKGLNIIRKADGTTVKMMKK